MLALPWGSLPPLDIPPLVQRALGAGAPLTISVSGGIDSQALLWGLAAYSAAHGLGWQLVAVTADLGRFEWPDSHVHTASICAAVGVPLHVVRRRKGDLLDRIDQRQAAILASAKPERPFWPSATERYCTSDLKRGPINTFLRSLRKRGVILDAQGIRADESDSRAARVPLSIRVEPTSKVLRCFTPADAYALRGARHRLVLTWYPLFAWSKADCFRACGTSLDELEQRRACYRAGDTRVAFEGWPCARSYVRGASRHSCAICVIASRGDIAVGVREHPDLAHAIAERERASGWRFRTDVQVAELIAASGAEVR